MFTTKVGTLATAALTIAIVASCSPGGQAATVVESPSSTQSPSAPAPDVAGTGIVAKPASTAFPMEARNIRLVRLNSQDLALQFELYNGTQKSIEPYDIGMGEIERELKLVDLPRATTYDVQANSGFDGRVSNQYADIAPGTSVTISAVFSAPPQDTTAMWFMNTVTQPVEVPVQPEGSAALTPDPVLTSPRGPDPYTDTLFCTNAGAETPGAQTPVRITLPGDVLFEFAKSDLTPAAESALDAVESQLESSAGTITIEGHTDSIGDDPSNQQLSEARAASVQAALAERLGDGFTFTAVGFGETQPVAPNTNPDGSDNPDGRAQNRRVEIRTGDVTTTAPPELAARPLTDDLAAKGAQATVVSVKRIDGHLLTTVKLTNPTSAPIEVGPGSGITDVNHRPVGISIADRTNRLRANVCRSSEGESLEGFSSHSGPPSNEYEPETANSLPPGQSVQLWGFYAAPPADVTSVDVEIGGLAAVVPTPITD
jgi:outer membrane protein OmpA-like peptidoglycan-associated protein